MPIFMRALMTSLALMAIRCASSLTVIVSPISTSRTTGAVGFSNACCGSTVTGTLRRRCFFFLRRRPPCRPRRAACGRRRAAPRPSVLSWLSAARARPRRAAAPLSRLALALRRSSSARCLALPRRPRPRGVCSSSSRLLSSASRCSAASRSRSAASRVSLRLAETLHGRARFFLGAARASRAPLAACAPALRARRA